MHDGRPSHTAQIIALMRALSDIAPQVPGFSDPIAAHFLAEPYASVVQQSRRLRQLPLGKLLARVPLVDQLDRLGTMRTFNQLRTVVLDQAVAAAAPGTQLVILGAGLDGRAWRLAGLAATVVYEVDHPATQAWKKQRAAALPLLASAVHYVAVDFTRDDLGEALAAAGHDASQPTIWLWEGVTMYLEPAQTSATLTAIAQRSAAGSTLALTYLSEGDPHIAWTLFVAALGEPFKGRYTPAELAAKTAAAGFTTVRDSGVVDWQRELAPALRMAQFTVGVQWHERIWVGQKD